MVELKIEGMYQVQDNLHHRKYILYFHGKYIERERESGWPSERRRICSWWHCRVLFCKRDQYFYFTPLIPAEESTQIATAPYLVLFQLRSVGILYGVTLKDRHLNSFTPTALTNTCTDKITLFRQNC